MGFARRPLPAVVCPDHAADGRHPCPEERRDFLCKRRASGPDKCLRIQRPRVLHDILQSCWAAA
eukprot:12451696-Alexandrium_andersonii.AAC.1